MSWNFCVELVSHVSSTMIVVSVMEIKCSVRNIVKETLGWQSIYKAMVEMFAKQAV
jgi:hypothetical protein